jgi:hypothetical protein
MVMLRTLKSNGMKIKLLLDITLTIAYVVLMKPVFTGESWHEWLGLAIGGAANV